MSEPDLPIPRAVSFVALPVQQLTDLRQKLNAVCTELHAYRCGVVIASHERKPVRQCIEGLVRSLATLDGLIKSRRDEGNGGAA